MLRLRPKLIPDRVQPLVQAFQSFGDQLEQLKTWGLAEENEREIRLTTRGRFFADEICAQFHHPKYLPFPPEQYNQDGPLYLSRPIGEDVMNRACGGAK